MRGEPSPIPRVEDFLRIAAGEGVRATQRTEARVLDKPTSEAKQREDYLLGLPRLGCRENAVDAELPVGGMVECQAGHAPGRVWRQARRGTTRSLSGARAGSLGTIVLRRPRRRGCRTSGSRSWVGGASVTPPGAGVPTARAAMFSGRGRKSGRSSGGVDDQVLRTRVA